MRQRIFTWHVHGNYLYYLTQIPHEFYLPLGSKTPQFPWGDNVHEVPLAEVSSLPLDLIMFQSRQNYETDQYEVLTPRQRRVPKLYIEHDPPRQHPTDTKHWVDDGETLIVHVTHFNELMWDNGAEPTTVIEHGVKLLTKAKYRGTKPKGLVVINNLNNRGRRLGLDIYEEVSRYVPLDLIGIDSERLGGLGEIAPQELPKMMADYRFLFNPIRYTSLGLTVIEAMMVGLPVVALATTELVTAIQNGFTGFIDTDLEFLMAGMEALINKPALAESMSTNAKRAAKERFNIHRFVDDWNAVIAMVTSQNYQEYLPKRNRHAYSHD